MTSCWLQALQNGWLLLLSSKMIISNFQGLSEKFVGPGKILISGALFFRKHFPDIEKVSKKFSGLTSVQLTLDPGHIALSPPPPPPFERPCKLHSLVNENKSQVCYASEIWSPHQCNLKIKLEQIQRRGTRWILKVKVGDVPYRDRLSILNMLPLCYDREIRDLMFFYKALHGFYDLNVEDFVSFVTHGRTRPSSNSTVVLKTPYCKTTTFQASFFNRIVKIWNSICKVATCSSFTSVTTFKTFLINHYNELLLNVFDANLTCTWSVVRDCACHRS